MKILITLVLFALSVQGAFSYFGYDPELEADRRIARIDRMLASGEEFDSISKESELSTAIRFGSERLLEHVVSRVLCG